MFGVNTIMRATRSRVALIVSDGIEYHVEDRSMIPGVGLGQRGARRDEIGRKCMERRVKIVTTLGPAVSTPDRLLALISAGADVVRINAAHGTSDERATLIHDVRVAADQAGKRVPILFDLRGLKIRTGNLPDGVESVPVTRGDLMRLEPGPVETTPTRIGINYPQFLEVVEPGSRVLISDGLIELHVESVESDHAMARVFRDGDVRGRQGVTLPGAHIQGGALTAIDIEDIQFACQHGVDYLGLSFLNDADDLKHAREISSQCSSVIPGLISKIERPEALENIEGIADASDGIMVARGDLGVQLPPERVPRAQKQIIQVANRKGIPVITATQMLESMIEHPVATRAETSDVANAVWDGTDAVMLSAETAVGRYGFEAVRTMDRIIREVEKDGPVRSQASHLSSAADMEGRLADAIARAAFALSDQTPIQYLIVFTKTGGAARRVAKYRPYPPMIAVTDTEEVARKLMLVWGIQTVISPVIRDPDAAFTAAGKAIVDQGLANEGDLALIVGALPMYNEAGKTNLLHFRRLG